MGLQKGRDKFNDIEIYNKIKGQETIEIYLTWPVIIMAFLIFFPLGIYLIYKKTNKDKEVALKMYKVIKFFGWLFLAVFAFSLKGYLEFGGDEYIEPLTSSLFFAAIFFIWGRNSKARSIRYKQYIKSVLIEQKRKVEDIANSLRLSKQIVRNDLFKMSAKNYFPAGYFDMSSDSMIFPYMDFRKEYPKTTIKTEIKVVTCKGCGASNTMLEGAVAECEYCGSKLN